MTGARVCGWGYARELAAYWVDRYDWRSREVALNRFDQLITEIDGLDIYLIHQRSGGYWHKIERPIALHYAGRLDPYKFAGRNYIGRSWPSPAFLPKVYD